MNSKKIKNFIKIMSVATIFFGTMQCYNAYAQDINGQLETDTDLESVESAGSSSSAPVIDSIDAKKNSDGTIKFTVNASGGDDIGTGLLFYKFFTTDKNGKKQQVNQNKGIGRNYSLDNTFTCEPDSDGKCKIYVEVENCNNEKDTDSKEYVDSDQSDIAKNNITINNISITGDMVIGEKLNISTSVDSDDSNLNYRYVCIDASNNQTEINNSNKSDITWTPDQAGEYTIKVYVTDSNGNEKQKSKTITIQDTQNGDNQQDGELFVELTKNISNIYVGKSVKFTASASGGNGGYLYRFVLDSDGDYESTKYLSSNTFEWKPQNEGTYTMTVYVKDDQNNLIQKEMHFTVKSSQNTDDQTDSSDSSKVVIFLTALLLSSVCFFYKKKSKNNI